MGNKSVWVHAVLALFVLAAVFFGVSSKREKPCALAGSYQWTTEQDAVYYVFDPSGQYWIYSPGIPSVLLDEGRYEHQEKHIVALESTMNGRHTVVCGENGIYDFDLLEERVVFAKKVTKEGLFVNLPDRTASQR